MGSLGETQMQLNNTTQEVNHWKSKYDKKSSELQQLQSQIGLLIANTTNNNNATSSTIVSTNSGNSNAPTLLGGVGPGNNQNNMYIVNGANNNNNNNDNNNHNLVRQDSAITTSSSRRQRQNSQEMSFQSSEFSVNAISDKMSISGGSSLNPYNFMTATSVITNFPAINPTSSVIADNGISQIVASHLKHNENKNNDKNNGHNRDSSNSNNSNSFLCEEA